MELQIFLVAVLANCAYADGDFGGVDMSELEFIVGEMSTAECLQLATALRADGHEKDVEEGVTCLDDLLRYESAMEAEGSNIARGVFKHMLNRIGRQDLSDWLSISKSPTVRSRLRSSAGKNDDADSRAESSTSTKSSWSWYDTAITVALVYTGGVLLWLAVHVLVRKMTRDQCSDSDDDEQHKKKRKKRKRQSTPDETPRDSRDSANVEEVASFYHHYYRPPRPGAGRNTKKIYR